MNTNPNETGFFYNMSFSDYQQLSGISNSMFNELAKTPEDLKYYMDHGSKEETKAMKFGTHMHTAILEPERLEIDYVYKEKVDGRTKEGKAYNTQFELDNPGKIILTLEEYDAARYVRDKIAKHSRIPALLHDIKPEVSMQWDDEGLLLRGRADALLSNLPIILDVKTTISAVFHKFQNTIFTSGYHRQGAMYVDGSRTLGRPVQHYFILAIENTAPYKIALFEIPMEVINIGRKELLELKEIYRECKKHNVWDGYTEEIQQIGIPNWKLNNMPESYFE